MNQITGAWWMGLPTDPLSHAGLSVAVVFALHYILRQFVVRFASSRDRRPGGIDWSRISGWSIDYRLIILGALLPDLIDKSLQLWFFPEFFSLPGRSIAHTLVFNSVLIVFCLLIIPLIRFNRFDRSPSLLFFALASAGHLILDRMWESPATLFWPRFGLSYGHAENRLSPTWLDWTQSGIGPALLDWTGAIVLLIFAVALFRRGTFLKWIRIGVA